MSSAHRGECVTTGGLYRPTHLCVAHLNCTENKKQKSSQFFFGVVRLGGVFGEGGGGGGGEMFHVSGGRGLHGVSEGGGVI